MRETPHPPNPFSEPEALVHTAWLVVIDFLDTYVGHYSGFSKSSQQIWECLGLGQDTHRNGFPSR